MSGTLNLVSVGPGYAEYIAPQAVRALASSDTIVSYDYYLNWIKPWISGKEVHTTPLTQERQRSLLSIELARKGRKVSLISSGDIGVYAMAALAFEQMSETDTFSVQVVPGITAAVASASLLGAPLSHDFATLSLSDLLCPWDWIETRARHIAQADLSAVLYNVQSRKRQEGVYRILRIMLEHKLPETLCGVVRNAYRPGQAVATATLSELLDESFDMFTSIVVGNRFTRRKRKWIFTPRGYGSFSEPDLNERALGESDNGILVLSQASESVEAPLSTDVCLNICAAALTSRNSFIQGKAADVPPGAVWVFAGTSDGNALANAVVELKYPVVVSAATEYGGVTAAASCPGAHVLTGKLGKDQRMQLLADAAARLIVDATHPYACSISSQLMEIAAHLNLPYVRFERPSKADFDNEKEAPSPAEAAELAIMLGKRIFLATGARDLEKLLTVPGSGDCEWFVRVAPSAESIEKALALGVRADRICAMQGPFSRVFNLALWRQWQIDCVITKDSGEAGGYASKVEAARELAIPIIVIKRPPMEYPSVACDFQSVIEFVQAKGARK